MARSNAAQASLFDDPHNPLPAWPEAANDDGSVEIVLSGLGDQSKAPKFDPQTGAMEIALPDGSVRIDLNPSADLDDEDSDFADNLAEKIDPIELGRIVNDLLEGIDDDEHSRATWVNDRAKGLDLLGLRLEAVKGGADVTTAPLEGMSNVRHPMLLEAVLRSSANAYGELCPASGPAKVVNYGDEDTQEDGLADALEKDMNYFLTNVMKGYYQSYRSMLFNVMFCGMSFRKIYYCPLRRMPVSDTVDADDLIVNNTATDLYNASRVTHRATLKRSLMKRMQLLGVYRNVGLTQPTPEPTAVDRKEAQIMGIDIASSRPEDEDFTIYECYCELDIAGFEHKDGGEVTGLPLPYKVTIEKTSRQILEVRRNWDEDQEYEDFIAKIPFVTFSYVTGLGFYGIGLLHMLGNTVGAVTAAWREMLDAGMFASFPGFMYLQPAGRQQTNEFRVPPGGGLPFKSDAADIRSAIMPLPYKPLDAAFMGFIDNLAQTGQRVGGTADMPVGEGKQDAPVGTTLALIEQATKIESTVHKGLHAAQDEEFRIMKELFRADPESLWRTNKRCALGRNQEKTLMALEDCEIVPRADPNVPSRMHRLAKIAAVKQLQAANPMLYDAKAVDSWALPQIGIDDPESFFAPPQPEQGPPMDPAKLIQAQASMLNAQTNQAKAASDAQSKQAELKSKENLSLMETARTLAVHPSSMPDVQTVLSTGVS